MGPNKSGKSAIMKAILLTLGECQPCESIGDHSESGMSQSQLSTALIPIHILKSYVKVISYNHDF